MTKILGRLSLILLIIAGITWGLIGVFDFNLVLYVFGPCWATPFTYVLFGLASLWTLFRWKGR